MTVRRIPCAPGRRDELAGLRNAVRGTAPRPDCPVEVIRSEFDDMAKRTPGPDVARSRVMAGPVPAEWVGRESRQIFLHLHGGGYVFGTADTVLPIAAGLASASGRAVLVPEYRLAPENPFPAALGDVVEAYRWLLAAGRGPGDIVLSGDSAGGGLALASALAFRERDLPLPAGIVALYPWVDLTEHADRTNSDLDPLVTVEFLARAAAHYCGASDPRNPLISPIYGDLSGLPPVLIQVGGDEVLLPDSIRFGELCQAAGIDVQVEVWEAMFHLWHAVSGILPEAHAALNHVADWVKALSGTEAVRS